MFVRLQQIDAVRPVERHAVMNDVTLLRIADRGLQNGVDALAAVVVKQPAPGVDGAGYGHRMRPALRDLVEAITGVPVERGRCRRTAGSVEGYDLWLAFRRIDHEAVAANTGGLRFDHGLDRGGTDGCIHCIAAAA